MRLIADQIASLRAAADVLEAQMHAQSARLFKDYISDVPDGYDTVLGYLAKNHPDVLILCGGADPTATQRDGFKLMHWCRRERRCVLWVTAPRIMQMQGIDKVRAYPVDLLERRWA